jgi:hypothetical protein
MQHQPTPLPESIRQIAARNATQTTGPIRPVRLTNTGPLPAIQPPASVVIHLGSVQPSLVDLTPVSLSILVTGYEMAYKYRHVQLQDVSYIITHIFPDKERPSRIMARLEREDA